MDQYVRDYETREEGYFAQYTPYYEVYNKAAEYIIKQGYNTVGYLSNENYYDYPFMKMLESHVDRFEHVQVGNFSSIYEDVNYQPDCIMVIGHYIYPEDIYECNGAQYQVAYAEDEGWIYMLDRIK